MPNSNASSGEIDFVTALGRLLRSGTLRDAFAADPGAVTERLGVRPSDRARVTGLVVADLEFQADVLLRKRFTPIRGMLSRTCAQLGNGAWPEFRAFARATDALAERDAEGFCAYLAERRSAALCSLEHNRSRFAQSGGRCAVHVTLTVPSGAKLRRPLVQLLLGGRGKRWHEWRVSIGL